MKQVVNTRLKNIVHNTNTYWVKENKQITGSEVFEGFLGFPRSGLDENWRKSS